MKQKVEDAIVNIHFIITIICIVIAIIIGSKSCNKPTIKQSDTLDSIKIEKSKLDESVKQLDSIKNAKIVSVKELNNDSTIILFYKLIRK